MNPVIIDKEKCVGCGECVKDCVAGFLHLENGKAETKEAGCIKCGHCYAVCPANAVTLQGMKGDNGEYVSMTEFDSERLLQAMKSRRSVRRFKACEVEKEKLDMILEAGRYCPTASNSQDVAFTILGSRQAEIEKICVELFRKGKKLAAPAYAAAKNMEIDDKFFFKGAPLVIVVSAKSTGNANLASSYMEIMAASLGLGVLYSGFFVICTKLSGKLRKILSLPDGHSVKTCMVIGYPDVKYRRIPDRKELNVKEL